MSSNEPNRDRKVRRKIDPATATVEELLSYLAVDPSTGLSLKEAARRLAASTAEPLYRSALLSPSRYMKKVVADPALWLLLAVSFFSLFFERISLGLSCLLMVVGNVALCGFFLWRAHRIDAAFSAYDAPLCRVLRGGRIHRVGAAEVVRGDILLFYKGDMIPADCRLLRSEGFSVLEREISTEPNRPGIRLEKDAQGVPDPTGSVSLSPVNMVFAGGVCREGFALAVVLSVGSETHLGGLTGGLDTPHGGRLPALLKKLSRHLSLLDLGLLCLVVPLTVLGIFTLRSRYELLDIFLSALALSGLSLTEHVLAKGLYLNAALRRAAAVARDRVNTADIRSATAPERLSEVTDLLLVGTSALHDGADHPELLVVGDRLYHVDRPEADEEARTAVEYLYLYRQGIRTLSLTEGEDVPLDTLVTLADALADWAELDTEGLLVRAKEMRAEKEGVSVILPTVDGNRRVTVLVTDDYERVRSCDYGIRHGSLHPMTAEAHSELYRSYREAIRTGHRVLFLLTSSTDGQAVRAMLSYAPHACRKTSGAVKGLETAGIRVAAFLHEDDDVCRRVLTECGFSEAYSVGSEDRDRGAELLEEGVRGFTACDTDFVLHIVRALQEKGRVVAVLSVEEEDTVLLGAADLAVTCAPSIFVSAENGHPRLSPDVTSSQGSRAHPDGTPDSSTATDLCRRRADVVIRRSASDGGGVMGLRHAFLCAAGIRKATADVLGFLLVSQGARLCLTVLPILLGLSILPAPTLLVSGLGVDLLILISASRMPFPSSLPRQGQGELSGRSLLLSHRNGLIAAAVGALVPTLTAAIPYYLSFDMGGDPGHFLCLCLLSLQIALYRMAPLPRRDRTVFFTTLGLVLVYVAALAVALGAGLDILWSLVLPLLSPLTYVIVKLLLDRVSAGKAVG